MAAGRGALPGTGFDPDDPVEVLDTASDRIMETLRSPDGEWLIVPTAPDLPSDLPTTPTIAVVVDTGVCDDHPSLVGRIIEQIDVTGEGIRDENGHGTAVAAILAVTSPYTQIISVKALDRRGKASVARLSHGLRVAGRLLEGRGDLINLSAGRRTPTCTENCPLCVTVREIKDAGIEVVAAAGNEPGVTFCPARVGYAVTTPDPWAARGDIIVVPPGWSSA